MSNFKAKRYTKMDFGRERREKGRKGREQRGGDPRVHLQIFLRITYVLHS